MQAKLVVRAALLCAAVVISGCGGGKANVTATNQQGAQAQPAAANANLVVTSEGGMTRSQGRFEALQKYDLARSQRPMLSSGEQGQRYRFDGGSLQGYYRVYAWWPRSEWAGAAVDITVMHAGGAETKKLDPRKNPGHWQLLGIYGFNAKDTARVELSAPTGTRFIADAMRFEYVGASKPPLTIRSDGLSIGQEGVAYAVNIEAESGSQPYSWMVAEGRLAPGLSLDARSGRISGNPTQSGSFPLKVRVVDAKGESAQRALTLFVATAASVEPVSQRPAKPADGTPNGTAPSLSGLLNLVVAAPEGSWIKANLNFFVDVHAPEELRPLFDSAPNTPTAIIRAWSSFAWDPNRGDLWIYGGGHANSAANDVYRWRGSTRMWERASLPSEMTEDDLGNTMAVDGYNAAPPSAHTYDNNMFLPVVDRFITFGGASFWSGWAYVRQTAAGSSAIRPYGPFLFNPNLADPNKVGGTTGSHVKRVAPHPEILGGNMWQNRDIYVNIPGNPPLPGQIGHRDGCTAYALENGKDVVYVTANPGLGVASYLYKYTISNVNSPSTDTWQLVGVPPPSASGLFGQQSCAYDAQRKLYVRRAGFGAEFAYWDLNSPGTSNNEVQFIPTDLSGEYNYNRLLPHMCGMDFDPVRAKYTLWCGDGRVWLMTPPATNSPTGWVITKQPPPVGAVPNGDYGTGILGKWKYIPNLDAYMGLQDDSQGNIWIYKPIGWQNPGGGGTNQAPSVTLTQPGTGTTFTAPATIAVTASATDADGTISKVEFFQGATKLGEDLTAPYTLSWTNVPVGTYSLTARATDNVGASATSTTVNVTVGGTSAATVLSVSPGSATPGSTVTVNWSGIASPTGSNWIGFYTPGAPSENHNGVWMYVNCTKGAGTAFASGSCPFPIPSGIANGTYELRLHASASWTAIASTQLTISGGTGGGTGGTTTLSANPTSTTPGSTVTVSWGNIASATGTNWIGFYTPGSASENHNGVWMYVSCSKTAGAAFPSGSCAFPIPSGIASGNYELRLHASSSWTAIASTPLTITGGATGGSGGATTLSVNPTSAASGSTVTVSWSNIASPTGTNWIGFYTPGAASENHNGVWMYVNCTKGAGAAFASGSCSFPIPAGLASGNYELRLHASASWTAIASTPIAIAGTASSPTPSPPSTTLSVNPTSTAAGSTVTVSWSNIASPTGTNWIGFYTPGAASEDHNGVWMYVNCSQGAGTVFPSGSCPFPIPAGLASGTYELRLHASASWTAIASTTLSIP